MELLDRYLAAVGALLPATQRPDILAELRDALLTQMEERQSQLGRALTTEETEALLKAHGRPAAVAASYRPQRPLIGPLLLPWYVFVLRVVLGISWIVALIGGVTRFVSGDPLGPLLGHLVQVLWSSAVATTGTLTVIAVALDRLGAERRLERWVGHAAASWRPARDLPPLVKAPPVATPGVWTFTGDVIGIGVIILWVSGTLDTVLAQLWGLDTVLDNLWAVAHVELVAPAPVLGWPVLVIAVAQTALHGMTALKLPRTSLTRVLFAGVKVVMLITLLVLLRHWPWLQIVDLPPAAAANAARGVNIGLGIAFGLSALATAGGLLRDLSSLVQASRTDGSSLPSR
jgi:hypothetical protein